MLERIGQHRNDWIDQQIEEGSSEAKRLRNKLKKHKFDELEREFVPDGWVSVSLLKLCQAVVDCHNKTAPYVDEGIPLIRTTNIRHGVINFKYKMKYITEETYDYWSRRCPPEAGDILFTREAPMGESAIVPEKVKLCMGQRMMLLRPFHQFTDVKYLHIALMEPLFQSRFQSFKVGVGVQHLRVGDVEKSVVALPSIEEQKVIVRLASDRLDAIERLNKEIIMQLAKSEKTKQSVLVAAFSGNLVENRPNNSAAGELLQRIQISPKKETKIIPMVPNYESPLYTLSEDMEMKNSNFDEIIRDSGGELTVDKLFEKSGFSFEEIEEFYEVIKSQVAEKRINVDSPYEYIDKNNPSGKPVKVRAN